MKLGGGAGLTEIKANWAGAGAGLSFLEKKIAFFSLMVNPIKIFETIYKVKEAEKPKTVSEWYIC